METKWKIAQTKSYPDTGGIFEVVTILSVTKEEFSDRKIIMSQFNVDPNAENFIPYNELTEETVITWVFSDLGEEEMNKMIAELESAIDKRIYEKENPPFIQGLPWGNKM